MLGAEQRRTLKEIIGEPAEPPTSPYQVKFRYDSECTIFESPTARRISERRFSYALHTLASLNVVGQMRDEYARLFKKHQYPHMELVVPHNTSHVTPSKIRLTWQPEIVPLEPYKGDVCGTYKIPQHNIWKTRGMMVTYSGGEKVTVYRTGEALSSEDVPWRKVDEITSDALDDYLRAIRREAIPVVELRQGITASTLRGRTQADGRVAKINFNGNLAILERIRTENIEKHNSHS